VGKQREYIPAACDVSEVHTALERSRVAVSFAVCLTAAASDLSPEKYKTLWGK